MNDKVYLFVFGTLRKDFRNHYLIKALSSYDFIGYGVTKKRYKMISFGRFPGIVKLDLDKRRRHRLAKIKMQSIYAPVKGEVYRVPFKEAVLNSIDHLEGHPDFFKREVQKIKVNGNEKEINTDSYIYILNNIDGQYNSLSTYPPIQLNLEEGVYDWAYYLTHILKAI